MSNLTPMLRRKLTSILPFGIIWLVNGLLFLFVEYAVISIMEPQSGPQSAITISPKIVVFASISIFFIGCLVGFLEVSFINKFFVKWTFIQKLLGKVLMYGMFFFSIIFIFYMLAASIEMKQSVFSTAVFNRYLIFLFSITNISTFVQIAFSLLTSLIYAEIEDNLGQSVFLNFFTGKYHKPIEEERIFMFTDMKDSTTIAETMGHELYFEFLRHYYNDLSSAIINSYGEVYQYIGDEIVISWDLARFQAVEHAIECFFEMKRALITKQNWYVHQFNMFPDFKGAIHLGKVTTGEIGALKKEIFFTGDVLNTTARMQGLCNKYKTDLIVSKQIVEDVRDKHNYVIDFVGTTLLKGKKKSIDLFTLKSNN